MARKFGFIPVIVVLALLSACGGGADLETDTRNPGAASTGLVVDGYLAIAKVVCDTNGNGVADSGEPVTYTNTLGNYVFTSGCAYGVFASGGTNIDTNSAFLGQLRAPAGASVVTPLTTLVAAGLTQAQVIDALSLPTDTKILTTDPAATDVTGLVNSSLYKKSLAIQHLTEKITNLFTTLSAQKGSAVGSAATADIYAEVAQAIAAQIKTGASFIASDGQINVATVNKMVAAAVDRVSHSSVVPQNTKTALDAAGGANTLPGLVDEAFASQAQLYLKTTDANIASLALALKNNPVVENKVALALREGALDSKTTSAAITALKATISLKKQDPITASAQQSSLFTSGTTLLTSVGGSGSGAVSFRVTSGECTLSGATLSSSVSEGPCTVVAKKAADDNFEQASSEPITISVYLREQVTLVTEVAQSNLFATDQTALSTKGGSGTGAVSFAILSGACKVSGSTLTAPSTTGDCTVVAIKAGDTNYRQTIAQPITISISSKPQASLVTAAAQSNLFVSGKTTLTASGGSGAGAVTFRVESGLCTLSGSTLTAPASAGTCTVVATKAADATYAQVSSQALSIKISLQTAADLTISATPTSLFISDQATLSTSGGLGTGTVTYTVTAGTCTLSGATLTAPASAGTCTIVASKAADSTYAQATSEPLTIGVSLKTQVALAVAADQMSLVASGTATLSTTGGSGTGAVAYRVASGACTTSGATLTAAAAAGTCTVVATKSADGIYAQATSPSITITVRAAQTLPSTSPIDFETTGRGAAFAWSTFENDTNPVAQIVANPSKTGTNTSDTVMMLKALKAGNPWAGFQSAHQADLGEVTLTTSNALLKMMVYKPVISDVGLKFASSKDASSGEVKVANTLTYAWEQLTFNFCGRVGEVNDQIIVYPDFNIQKRTSDTTSYVDNITFNACPTATVPTTEPAYPTALTADVISLYGDGYTTVTGTDTPKWSGMTTTASVATFVGNNVLKLSKFNYQGFTNSAPLNLSSHTTLHIDFWSQTATTIEVKLVSLEGGLKQQSIYVPVSAGTWTSKDIPLSSFTIPDKTKFQQLVLAAANVGQILYVDNIYFWK